ncbi:uncharacterized protein METZ01_LOCUS268758 [marine metagenome]|uniref:Uncharacterized protein n=1 Tax=marine metagenome TaxID=408172 RepID=A0A382JTT1_9ZZZZ
MRPPLLPIARRLPLLGLSKRNELLQTKQLWCQPN